MHEPTHLGFISGITHERHGVAAAEHGRTIHSGLVSSAPIQRLKDEREQTLCIEGSTSTHVLKSPFQPGTERFGIFSQ